MWWAALLGGLVNIAGTLAGQALIALGIGVATYTGMDASIQWLKTGFISAVGGLPAEIVGMLALMKVGSCVSMVISAILIKLTLSGLTSGTMKAFVKR